MTTIDDSAQIDIFEQGETPQARTTVGEFFAANECFEPEEVAEIRQSLADTGEARVLGFVGCWWLVRLVR